jgi:hypothetical protein
LTEVPFVKNLLNGEIVGEHVGRIASHEELCEAAGVDPDLYETSHFNTWTTSFKEKETEEVKQVTNWARKLNLRRDADLAFILSEEQRKEFFDEIRKIRPKPLPKIPKPKHEVVAEIQLADAHMRMLSWKEETGENYDLDIQERILLETGLGLIARAKRHGATSVQFVVGHDLFHADGPEPFTAKSKNLLDVDSRYQKGFRVALQIFTTLIDTALKEGLRVYVMIVPGNHDGTQTFFLGETLAVRYEKERNVEIDNSAALRKYSRFGKVLVMHTHGSDEKVTELPFIMARERPEDWALTEHRECHVGHLHQEMVRDFKGVVFRRVTAITATDLYHKNKGFIGNVKAGQCFIWDTEAGLDAILYHPVRYSG